MKLNECCLRLVRFFDISLVYTTVRITSLVSCFLSTGRCVILNEAGCMLGCVTFAKLSPRQKSIMKYELGIGVDTPARARQGYHDPAVMHLRNCEPRGKENTENISRITPNFRATCGFYQRNAARYCTAPPWKLSQLAVTSVVAHNYIKTVHDGN